MTKNTNRPLEPYGKRGGMRAIPPHKIIVPINPPRNEKAGKAGEPPSLAPCNQGSTPLGGSQIQEEIVVAKLRSTLPTSSRLPESLPLNYQNHSRHSNKGNNSHLNAGRSAMHLKGNLFTLGFPCPCKICCLIDLSRGHLLRE